MDALEFLAFVAHARVALPPEKLEPALAGLRAQVNKASRRRVRDDLLRRAAGELPDRAPGTLARRLANRLEALRDRERDPLDLGGFDGALLGVIALQPDKPPCERTILRVLTNQPEMSSLF